MYFDGTNGTSLFLRYISEKWETLFNLSSAPHLQVIGHRPRNLASAVPTLWHLSVFALHVYTGVAAAVKRLCQGSDFNADVLLSVGEGRRVMSWIWLVEGGLGDGSEKDVIEGSNVLRSSVCSIDLQPSSCKS